MSSYGELIQALRVLKNVKEKRHGIKTLASLCANRAFQVRIVQRGGWRTAILPLIISLDEDCRMYAALAVANLSTSAATHPQLLEEEVLRHLVPILQSEEVQEVIAYVLNALGNFACSDIMWHELQQMNAADGILTILKQTQREEIRINCLFCLANLTADPWHRKWMMGKEVYEIIWGYMQDPNKTIMSYSLAILRGLAVETEAQELFPSMGLLPLLLGIYHSQYPQALKTLSMDLLLHFSMFKQNAGLMMEKEVAQVIELAALGTGHVEYVPIGIAIIANICESVDLHDRIVESPLFEVLTEHIHNDNTNVQTHVIRALMQLSLSPKYHHVILTTGAMANVCPIALTQRLSIGMRTNALQMMAAVCATHPTTPTASDIIDLMFLIVNSEENIDIRRAAALVIANASSDTLNLVIEEDQRLVALRVTGGTGGFGLTIGSNVDRSTVKDLHGTIKKFFPDKGWGFIIQDSGGPNLFFHTNAIESGETGSTTLVVGSRVRYESMWDEKRGSRKAQRVAMEETNVLPESNAEVTDKLSVDPEEDLVVLATSDSDGEEWELVT